MGFIPPFANRSCHPRTIEPIRCLRLALAWLALGALIVLIVHPLIHFEGPESHPTCPLQIVAPEGAPVDLGTCRIVVQPTVTRIAHTAHPEWIPVFFASNRTPRGPPPAL
jgi:hypothetical protein